jgi:hypothetical protein
MWKDSGMTDAEKVALAKADLEIELETSEETIDLPTSGLFETTITWASSDEDIIDPVTGIVAKVESDTLVILTATIKLNDIEDTKLFDVIVVAEGEVIPETIIETFDDQANTSNSYSEGSFTGINSQEWDYTNTRWDRKINNSTGWMTQTGYLQTTLTSGLSKISFDYVRDYTGTKARGFVVEVSTDGGTNWETIDTITVDPTSDVVQTYSKDELTYKGTVVLRITGTGNQKLLDNLSYTSNP